MYNRYNYGKYRFKNKRKLKIVLFERSKSIHVQSRNLTPKIRNTRKVHLFMLKQNMFVKIKLPINVYFLQMRLF